MFIDHRLLGMMLLETKPPNIHNANTFLVATGSKVILMLVLRSQSFQ